MPIIEVNMLAGRDRETRAKIIKELTDGFVRATGNAPESVRIILRDVAHENWGVAGVPKEPPG